MDNQQTNTINPLHKNSWSAADVKMEIPVLARSLQSSILSFTSSQMGKTFWGVGSAAVEQTRRKANMVAQGDVKFGPSSTKNHAHVTYLLNLKIIPHTCMGSNISIRKS